MPSSFTRRTTASTPIPPAGCFSSPSTSSVFLLPTGLPSLDDILGGGLPLGATLLVIAPDGGSTWGKLVEKYFISQGLISGQEVVVVGEENSTREMVKGSMWVEKGSSGAAAAGEGSESETEAGAGGAGHGAEGGVGSEDAKRIAWRYDKLSKYKTTTSGGGHNAPLSLTTVIPTEILSKAESSNQLTYISLTFPSPSSSGNTDQYNVFDRTISELYAKLDSSKSSNKAAKRVVVHELGSLDWSDGEDIKSEQIHRFLHSLRYILRNKSSTTSALITLPSDFVSAFGTGASGSGSGSTSSSMQALVKSLSWAVDGCVELRGFADDPTLPPLFSTTHGLLTLHSYPTSHTLLPNTLKHSTLLGVAQSSASSSSSAAGGGGGGGGGAGENNLGFKLKRKKFVLETVHLGVEGGTNERRTEAPPSALNDALASGPGVPKVDQGQGQVEGIERPDKKDELTNTIAGQTKKPKHRVKVRFGDDQVLVGKDELRHDHHHHHDHDHEHGHEHQHDHDHGKSTGANGPVPRVELRHDRPDLYEF